VKNPNSRAGNHAGKTRRSAQSAKSTKTAPGNSGQHRPNVSRGTIIKLNEQLSDAVFKILQANQTDHGLPEVAVSALLPLFHQKANLETVRGVLLKFEQIGLAVRVGNGWKSKWGTQGPVEQYIDSQSTEGILQLLQSTLSKPCAQSVFMNFFRELPRFQLNCIAAALMRVKFNE